MTRNKMITQMSLILMLIPSVIILILFAYRPMIGILIAFEDYVPTMGIFKSPWIGLENFLYMAILPDCFRVLYNTIFIASMKIVALLVVPIFYALLLNEISGRFVKRSVQTMIYLPYFLSWIILGGILLDILSPSTGIVNRMLQATGIEPIFFLGDNRYFPYVLVLSDTWKNFGFGTIVYLASLSGVDQNLYEAAIIDGAGRWKQTVHVTLPGIMPIVVLMTVLSLGDILNAGFEQVFNLYSPVVYQSGDIIDTLTYRIGMINAQYGVSTAVGLFKSVVACIMILTSYKLADKYAGYKIF